MALTSDGSVHHWTHGVANPAADIYNIPSTPAAGQGPAIAPGDRIKRVSIGVGVCAGVTEQGKVHTWRALWRGADAGLQGPGTPLGRENSGLQTVVPSLGKLRPFCLDCLYSKQLPLSRPRFLPITDFLLNFSTLFLSNHAPLIIFRIF